MQISITVHWQGFSSTSWVSENVFIVYWDQLSLVCTKWGAVWRIQGAHTGKSLALMDFLESHNCLHLQQRMYAFLELSRKQVNLNSLVAVTKLATPARPPAVQCGHHGFRRSPSLELLELSQKQVNLNNLIWLQSHNQPRLGQPAVQCISISISISIILL